jgi:O-succinylhomoserine sulfhydrylase
MRRQGAGEEIFKFLRTAGPSLSPFNAWVILKGLETLSVRMKAQSANALEMAHGWKRIRAWRACTTRAGIASPIRTGDAAAGSGGAIVSFEVKGEREAAWRVVDNCRLLSITANLGDTKTTITHPASTTHGRISAEARAASGIGEGLLRIAVGLESPADLQADLARGFG